MTCAMIQQILKARTSFHRPALLYRYSSTLQRASLTPPCIAGVRAARRNVHVEARLDKLGIVLPKAIVPPQGSYVVGYQTGKLLYVSGHIPMTPEGVLLTGTVGDNMSVEEGAGAARLIALNMIATLKCDILMETLDEDIVSIELLGGEEIVARGSFLKEPSPRPSVQQFHYCTVPTSVLLGDLDRVKQIVKLNGFVQCVDGFIGQPQVVNGASDLLVEVFQEKGIHARTSVGNSSLPLDMPVELEAIVEVEH